MPRQLKRKKPYIVVFCEGESEQAHMDFLKKGFKDVTSIKRPSSTELFEGADSKFKKDKSYRDYAEVTNEIWFFLDVGTRGVQKRDSHLKIVKRLCSLRKKPDIKVRLLMTVGCVKYWFMLHYKMFTPPIQTITGKEHIVAELIEKVPDYQKGGLHSISKIARNYPGVVKNSKRTLPSLLQDGLPGLNDVDERNYWPCRNYLTFSNIYEAIDFLTSLQRLFL